MSLATVPPIVPIILACATRLRTSGALDEQSYRAKLERLCREELDPRGLHLECEPLRSGGRRFVIRSLHGEEVKATVECRSRRPVLRARRLRKKGGSFFGFAPVTT